MKNDKVEKEIEQAKESVKICKQNIENMKKNLSEIYGKINSVQELLKNSKSTSKSEIARLTTYQSKLAKLANSQKSVITELQMELKISEDKLRQLEHNAFNNNS